MVNLIIPDKWQQDAVNLLREGKDVVVQAPTGAGKTYIFELYMSRSEARPSIRYRRER